MSSLDGYVFERTFHNIDSRTDVAFLDDHAVLLVLDEVH